MRRTALIVLLAVACSTPPEHAHSDPPPVDETGAPPQETGVAPDTGGAETGDSGAADTSASETGHTGQPGGDTGLVDTGMPADTAPPGETGLVDTGPFVDFDGDGSPEGVDCDDRDPSRTPGTAEHCDGVDNDCNPATQDVQLATAGGVSFASVQAAVDIAAPGSVVSVCPGTYLESVVVSADLELVGIGGAASTILDAGGVGAAVEATQGALVLRGLTLTGGAGVDRAGVLHGGGLAALDAASALVEDCAVAASTADVGGGIAGPASGSLTLRRVVIAGNTAAADGGGVYGSGLVAEDLRLQGNAANRGGGLFLEDASVASLLRLDAVGNHAVDRGGVAYVGPDAVVGLDTGNVIANTSDRYAACFYLDARSSFTATGSVIDNNSAVDKGGGFYASGAVLSLTDTTLVGNRALWGGAAFVAFDSALDVTGGALSYNLADLGAALFVYVDTTATLTNTVLEGNVAGAGGGARLWSGVVLDSVGTSWGTGVADNTPDDVSFQPPGGSYGAFGADETFTCDTTTNTCS